MPRLFKNLLLWGAMYGVVLGIGLWIALDNPKTALILALIGGVIFGSILAVITERLHKEFKGRFALAPGEHIVREDLARRWEGKPSVWSGKNHVGYLRVTNQRVVFTPRAANKSATVFEAPLASITETAAFSQTAVYAVGLRLRTAKGEENFNVTIGTNDEWVQAITQARGS
jgi:hypothetical protein